MQMRDASLLAGRRIFITGATGFVGRTLLDHAAEAFAAGADFEICGLSRNPDAFFARFPIYGRHRWLSMVPGDILNLPAPDGRFTDVIHAAADTQSASGARLWARQIVDGTAHALEFACQSGASRFLHTSSGAVYGPQPTDVSQLAEDNRCAPPTEATSSVYGQAKRLAEQLCTAFHFERGLGTINARCFAFIGRHLPLDGPYAIGNFIRDALFADRIVVKGDGRAVRSYLDGRDTARWLFHMLAHGAAGQAYNVGSDRPMSMVEIARCVAECLAPGKAIVIENRIADASGRSVYVPSILKAEQLGLRPEIQLEKSLDEVACFVRGGQGAA